MYVVLKPSNQLFQCVGTYHVIYCVVDGLHYLLLPLPFCFIWPPRPEENVVNIYSPEVRQHVYNGKEVEILGNTCKRQLGEPT